MKRLFVTGTDTGVGKTVVTAGLAAWCRDRGIDAGVLKPIETGVENGVPKDGRFHREAADLDQSLDEVVPVQYEEPLAPHVAAGRAGREVSMEKLQRAFERQSEKHDLLFVEGAGGLLVPINEQKTMADLAMAWRLPVLVVAPPSLGTLNHSALTVEVARQHGLTVSGLIISGYPNDPDVAERTNPEELQRLTGEKLLGKLPWISGLRTDEAPGEEQVKELVENVDTSIKLREILPELLVNQLF